MADHNLAPRGEIVTESVAGLPAVLIEIDQTLVKVP